jgi:hypothetical protein
MQQDKNKRRWQREIPDGILLMRGRKFTSIPSAESLHPGVRTLEKHIMQNDDRSKAILYAWRFRPLVEVLVV